MGRYKLRPAWRNNIRGKGQDAAAAYRAKVLGYNPIAYWPLNETAGVTANCLVNPLQDGTYTGVTLANMTGPNGDPAPYFDGANDYVNVHSATLAAAFDGDAGTAMGWARVANAGVWTDAAYRRVLNFGADAANYIEIGRTDQNGQLRGRRMAAAAHKTVTATGLSSIVFNHYAITWDKVADEMKFFINGVQQGLTQNGLAAWAGALANDRTLIGASVIGPPLLTVWHGWLAHVALWTSALAPATILDLATV